METLKFNKEFFLVKFPIIFPLIYAFILYQFPNFETQLIIIYSVIMTFFSIFGKNETQLQYLIIIPIIGQMLHFYLDSQLWKFSQKHNRNNTLIHLNNLN